MEIDGTTRRLKAVDGLVADVPNISPIPAIGVQEALRRLAEHLHRTFDDLEIETVPQLYFYPDKNDRIGGEDNAPDSIEWRLTYLVTDVAVEQPDDQLLAADSELNCGVSSPFGPKPHNFLFDANSGEIILSYPAYALLDVPVACTGTDVQGNQRSFDGIQLNQNTFQLTDPLRSIETCDAKFADIATSNVPATPLQNSGTAFPGSANAAVTAHVLASQVFDFFNNVLKRNGIDDKGMKLVSMVNCYSSLGNNQPSPFWRNASWWKGRMWYGSSDNLGQPLSTARFLDVMAHELAHGVTSTTANLIYKNQSGALNESFSDIFGILIKNWFPGEPNPLTGWSWTLGDEWNGAGTVLRNMEDPTKGEPLWPNGDGQPAHMNDYVNTTQDNGGVHINSGIHNRAFYNVATAANGSGNEIIRPLDVAILYYLTLTKLAPMSTFRDCRRTLLNVATTRFVGSPQNELDEKLTTIRDAYDAVGIN